MSKKEIDIIKRVISVLGSVDYARYSDGRAKTYLEYASGDWKDERKLIAPIIFPKFLEQVLGFKLGENIGAYETVTEGRDIPDYIPVDTRTHPFVFDCKGMDTDNLSKWYGQIKRYLEGQGLRYGILTNMRDLDVYTLESEQEIEAFNFSFVQLHKDYKENLFSILEKENTKNFLKFIERFRYIPLTVDEKFKKVAEAKPWTGKEFLNIDLLTKRLRYIVECIHEDASAKKKEDLISLKEADSDRAKAIVQEIELIASEIYRTREIREASIETFEDIIKAYPKSLLGKALDIFFYRVGYFTMTRLLLARAWEDIGFIDQSLYDGGLAKWYENFNREIRRVLKYAFGLAAERYKWLFNVDNNYTWYEPSDDTLIEALYELSNFNLGKLNQDVLGAIYEEYIDKVDKKQKGQYYTPREIIEFIWNRVGFTNPKAFFWYIEGKRQPKSIFDPATGSGGFLVEAARRIRDESDINLDDFQDLLDVRNAIIFYIVGSEISIFPYYITEVNLLIQLTPVVKRMIELKRRLKESLPLGIVPIDALSLYNPTSLLPEQEYRFDHIRNLLPLEKQKKAIFQKIKKEFDGKLSFCCSNPPYIGEKGNKELFRATLQRFPYWKEFYQGKMDYLYFFIILGISKLCNPGEGTPGGKLGFITTAYWPTADGASKLRKYILENAKIKEMIFFEDIKIFEYAKGQHNMVFILEKCAGKEKEKERAENRIKIVRVLAKHQEVEGKTIREKLRFLAQHIEKHIDKSEWQDECIKVFWSGVKQGELTEGAWNLQHDININTILDKIEQTGEKIGNFLHVGCGVLTNRDYVTTQNIKRLTRSEIERHGIKLSDGIFVLSEQEYNNLSLSPKERELIKPWYKNSEVARFIPDPHKEKRFLIYLRNKDNLDEYPIIKSHLLKFKGILDYQLHGYGETNKWYGVTRASEDSVLKSEKIFTPYRAERNTFAYSDADFFSSKDLYYITYQVEPPNIGESLKYILGLLNSTIIEFWCAHKLKHKGNAGEYYATPLKDIPIRRIDFDNPEEVTIHDEIVEKVEAIRDNLSELARYSKYFKDRVTRLKPQNPLPDINPESVIQALSSEKQFSLRTHPNIKIAYPHDFEEIKFVLDKVGKIDLTLKGPELKLISKDRKTIFIEGKEELLRIISSILETHKGESWIAIKEMPFIPESAKDYENKKQEVIEQVTTLRAEIEKLQASIDEMVFKLYGISENPGEINKW